MLKKIEIREICLLKPTSASGRHLWWNSTFLFENIFIVFDWILHNFYRFLQKYILYNGFILRIELVLRWWTTFIRLYLTLFLPTCHKAAILALQSVCVWLAISTKNLIKSKVKWGSLNQILRYLETEYPGGIPRGKDQGVQKTPNSNSQ